MVTFEKLPTGTDVYLQGEKLLARGNVSAAMAASGSLCYHVGASPTQQVTLYPDGQAQCTCGDALCEHVVAAALAADRDGRFKRLQQESEQALGEQMLAALSRAMRRTVDRSS